MDRPEDQGRGAAGPGELSGGVEGAARIVLRPIGNPLPLGFLALAGGTLVLSGLQLGWFQEEEGHEVALVIIAFVVPLQLVASVFGYLGRDVVAGTAMGVLAGTWLSIGLITLTGKPGATSDPLGVLLLLAAVAMTIPATAAAAGKVVPALVLATTALRFAGTGLFQITAAGTWEDVAGVVGLVLCGLAVYAAAAMAIEDAGGQAVLPLGRRGAGATSVGGAFGDQLRGIEREAGVRGQL